MQTVVFFSTNDHDSPFLNGLQSKFNIALFKIGTYLENKTKIKYLVIYIVGNIYYIKVFKIKRSSRKAGDG